MSNNSNEFWKQDLYLKPLIKIIKEIELLSLDIFDTLLFRLCSQPSDIFFELGKNAMEKGLLRSDVSPTMFQQLRILAEKKARLKSREKSGTSEVTLEDIYNMMPGGIGNLISIKNLEVEIEKKYCYVNRNILSLIVYCKEKGIKIALVSDMYLSSKHIKELLTVNNFPVELIDILLVSNEHGTDKLSGGLFDILCKKFPNIEKSKIIHIGDNKSADVEGAAKVGIKSVFYGVVPQKPDSVFEWEKVRFGSILPQLSSLRKLAINTGEYHEENERFWFDLGASILGPFFTMFSEWVVETCIKEGKKIILPFMREGKLLGQMIKNAASERGQDFRVQPIYISRQASYLASLQDFNEEELGNLFERNNLTVKDLFEMLKLNHHLEKFGKFKNTYLTDSHKIEMGNGKTLRAKIFEFFLQRNIVEELRSIIRDNRNLLIQYIKQKIGLNNSFVTVDLGFKGTIQNFLENAYRNQGVNLNITHLVALGSEHTKHLIMSGIDIRGWIGNAGENYHLIRRIMRSPEIIEELILANCGSTLGYRRDSEGKVIPLVSAFNISKDEKNWKELCQKGILHFQNLWFELKKQKPFLYQQLVYEKKDWAYLLLRLIEMPTPQEAKKLGKLHHDDNFGSSHSSTICRPEDKQLLEYLGVEEFLKRGSYGYHVTNVFWPQGVVTAEYPAYLFLKYLSQSDENSYLVIANKLIHDIKKKGFSSIVVYGAGEVGEAFVEVALLSNLKVEYIVDRKESLWGGNIKGVPIVSLDKAVVQSSHVYVVASLSFSNEIKSDIEARYKYEQVKPTIFTPI